MTEEPKQIGKAAARTSIQDSPGGKRERNQKKLRDRISAAGIRLFSEKGFDATTVSEIAAAAGTSRRTLFRYFPSKDDVVFDWLDEQGDIICEYLTSRARDSSATHALRRAMLHLADCLDADSARASQLTRIVYDTPSLSRRYQAENSRWEGEVTEILLRGQAKKQAFLLRVQVAAATAGLVCAMRAWAADESNLSVRHWVRKGFRALNDFSEIERDGRSMSKKK